MVPANSAYLCHGNGRRLDSAGLTTTVQWLQQGHARGAFQRMQKLTILMEGQCTDECLDSNKVPEFFLSILPLVGLWDKLEQCEIYGNFSIEMAAALLPSGLQQLQLSVARCDTYDIKMSIFGRFSQLIHLELDLTDCQQSEHSQNQIILDCTFPRMTSLCAFGMPLCIAAKHTVTACLPKVTILDVYVHSKIAQAVLDMQTLLNLRLTITDMSREHEWVKVKSSSSLKKLSVAGISHKCLCLKVEKDQLSFATTNIDVQHKWAWPTYKRPKLVVS